MRKFIYLIIAVLGNGLGSAMMYESTIGMSAWGSAAANVSAISDAITPGLAFMIVSIVFFIIAIIIHKKVILYEIFFSLVFLVSFSTIMDMFIVMLPDMSSWSFSMRLLVNIIGMLVLLFSISIHLYINTAVHPMDVFLRVLQQDVFHNVIIGTYVAYGCAFLVAVIFGLLSGGITNIGIGTVLTIVLGGSIMGLYDRYVIRYL
ncbi:DUF6198 family protein [Candidatus Xianfuyuplasma coldseepsis]|uniref:Uncharacterized protein n=1 Tax=Candidatus Xianfuyuplasma coldseepsis TaxID=2782163 RepID=A0A7L7KP84_9MOLU|nr:DUF6198 family protein [Xianfuyuplasma coldseepsis]QMS84591.1 hypothetical protein G4Z02_02105 [Xianfuyuplasma coldseepsis]